MNAGRGADGREEGGDSECRVEQCPQCQQEVVNKSLEDHLQEDCSHSVPCKLKHTGCDFEGPRYQMVEHMESNHLTLISKKEKEKREKREKLVKVTIGVVVIVVGVVFVGGGFLYYRKQLESIKSLEDSVANNARCIQQLRKELKKVKPDAQGSWWESFKSWLRS